MHMLIKKKICFQLLEVMIAMFLVLVCVIPVLNAYISMSQAQFNNHRLNQGDHLIHLIHGKIVENLYKHTIPWQDIVDGREEKLEKLAGVEDILKQLNHLSYECYYKLTIDKPQKKNEIKNKFLLRLSIKLKDTWNKLNQGKILTYEYLIYGTHQAETKHSPSSNNVQSNDDDSEEDTEDENKT